MKAFLLLSLIVFGFTPVESSVGNSDWKEVVRSNPRVEAVAEKSLTINSLDFAFEQEKRIDMIETPLNSAGKLIFKSPDKFKWHYQSPFDYSITYNGDKVAINNDGKISSFDTGQSKMFESLKDLISGLVQGDLFEQDQFSCQYFVNSDTGLKVTLVPVKGDLKSYLSEIVMFFRKGAILLIKLSCTRSIQITR